MHFRDRDPEKSKESKPEMKPRRGFRERDFDGTRGTLFWGPYKAPRCRVSSIEYMIHGSFRKLGVP